MMKDTFTAEKRRRKESRRAIKLAEEPFYYLKKP
jgi:hypothetical protein